MKKVLIPIIGSNAVHHYDIMRNEARIPTNIGFGLAKLGYDVNVVSTSIDNLNPIDNVHLSKNPIYKHYDYELTWSGQRTGQAPSDNMVCIVNYPNDVGYAIANIGENKSKMLVVCPYRHLCDYITRQSGIITEFLPPINPISCYHLGFLDYNYNPGANGNGKINIFIYVSSWTGEENTYGLYEYGIILERIRHIINGKYKIKLYIQIDSDKIKNNIGDIIRRGDEVEYIYKKRYDDYLNMISCMDIFLVKGNQFMASAGIYDITGLGKPMLYISQNWHNQAFRNPLFENKDEIIFTGENPNSIMHKVDEFMHNPSRKYHRFRESMKDSHFDIWKGWVEKIFK